MAADLIHLRPVVATDNVTNVANPDFLPDFDHNGVYGDPGDAVAMSDRRNATGYFLYPCLADNGSVTYETTRAPVPRRARQATRYQHGVAQNETDHRLTWPRAVGHLVAACQRPALRAARRPNPNASLCAAPQGLAPKSDLDGGQGLPAVVHLRRHRV